MRLAGRLRCRSARGTDLPDWNDDMLPFTHDDFLEVCRAYNAVIWPAQIVAYGQVRELLEKPAVLFGAGGRVGMSI